MPDLNLPVNITPASPVTPATPVAGSAGKGDGTPRNDKISEAQNEFARALDRHMENRDASANEAAPATAKTASTADAGDAPNASQDATAADTAATPAPDLASLLQGLMLPPAHGAPLNNAPAAHTDTAATDAAIPSAAPQSALTALLGQATAKSDAAAGVKDAAELTAAAQGTAKSAGEFADRLAAAAEPAAGKDDLARLAHGEVGAAQIPNGDVTQIGSAAAQHNATPLHNATWMQARADNTSVERAVVQTPVGAPGWAADVGNHVSMLIGKDSSSAELILTPPHLGRVEVQLTVDGNQTSAQFVAATPAAREALEQALPKLREFLADAGINLSQASVGSESSRNGGEAQGRGSGRRSAGSLDVTNVTSSPAWTRRVDGMVDTFA